MRSAALFALALATTTSWQRAQSTDASPDGPTTVRQILSRIEEPSENASSAILEMRDRILAVDPQSLASTEDRHGYDLAVISIAEHLASSGRHGEALTLLNGSTAHARSPHLYFRYRVFCECLAASGEYDQARSYARSALAALAASPDALEAKRPYVVPLQVVLAGIEVRLGRLDEAGRILRLIEQHRDDQGFGINVRLVELDWLLARRRLDRAEQLWDEIPPPHRGRARIYRLKIDLLKQRIGNAAAIERIEEDERISRAGRITALSKLAETFLIAEELDAAEAALHAVQQLRGAAAAPIEPTRAAFVTALRIELAIRREESIDPELESELDRFLEQSLDRYRNAAADDGIGPLHFDDRATALSTRMRALARHGETGAQRAFELLLTWQSLVQRPIEPVVDWASVRERVFSSASGSLVWIPGSSSSVLLVTTAAGTKVYELDTPGVALRALAAEARSAVRTAATVPETLARAQRAVATLRDALLPRVVLDKVLPGWGGEVFVCSSVLGWIPFEWFVGEDGVPLGLSHAVSHQATLSRFARADATGRPRSLALFASLRGRPGSEQRQVPQSVLDSARAAFDSVFIQSDAEIDLASVTSSTVCDSDVLHLVAHGTVITPPGQPAWRTMRFDTGADGTVQPDTLPQTLDQTAVLLSACSLGSASARSGGDLLAASLAGLALRRGAACVVTPVTDVEVGIHLRLMASLYRSLSTAPSVAAALRTARASFETPYEVLQACVVQLHGDPRFSSH